MSLTEQLCRLCIIYCWYDKIILSNILLTLRDEPNTIGELRQTININR